MLCLLMIFRIESTSERATICVRIKAMSEFRDHPNDPGLLLDVLVLSIHGLCKEEDEGKGHACKDCYSSLSR